MDERARILSAWLDDNLNAIDPGTDEIAQLIFSKMLDEHSCCDTQTWTFNHEIYQEINTAKVEGEVEREVEPTNCPNCDSNNFIQTSGHIVEGYSVGDSWHCLDCDHHWDRLLDD